MEGSGGKRRGEVHGLYVCDGGKVRWKKEDNVRGEKDGDVRCLCVCV